MDVASIFAGLLLLCGAMIALSAPIYALRYVIRHVLRDRRERIIGELNWYQLVPSPRDKEQMVTPKQQASAVSGFIQTLGSSSLVQSSGRGVASFVWMRDASEGLFHLYMGVDASHADRSQIRSLGQNLNAHVIEMAEPPNIPVEGLSVAMSRQPLHGSITDEIDAVGELARSLSDPDSIDGAIIMTIESMTHSEVKRWKSYFAERAIYESGESAKVSGVSNRGEIVAASVCRASLAATSISGDARDSERLLSLALSSLQSIGSRITITQPASALNRKVALIATLPIALCLIATLMFGLSYTFSLPIILLNVGAVVLASVGSEALVDKWFKKRLALGEIVVPSFVLFNPRWFIQGRLMSVMKNAGGREQVENRIAPPSIPQVLTLYKTPVTQFLSFPEAGVTSDLFLQQTPMIGVSSDFEHTIVDDDIFIGLTGRGQIFCLRHENIASRFFAGGSPEQGKTNLLEVIFLSMAALSKRNSFGARITPVWSETKGSGALEVYIMASKINPEIRFIDTNNPRSGLRLALEGPRVSDGVAPSHIVSNCNSLVSAMQYAFGTGIGGTARPVLSAVIRASMLMSEEEIRFLDLDRFVDPQRPNILHMSRIILGADSTIRPGEKMVEQLLPKMDLTDDRERYLAESIRSLSTFIGKKAGRGQDEALRSSRNRLDDLLASEYFWHPAEDRQDVYVGDIINLEHPVIVNLGPYYNELTGRFEGTDSQYAAKHNMMYLYMMWQYIKQNCTGWQSERRYVPMFFDEFSDIAQETFSPDIPNIVQSIGSEGRSFGTSLYVATQHFNRLSEENVAEIMAFDSKAWLRQNNEENRKRIHASLGDQQKNYNQDSLQYLSLGESISVIRQDNNKMTLPFTLQTPKASVWCDYLIKYDGRTIEAANAYRNDHLKRI